MYMRHLIDIAELSKVYTDPSSVLPEQFKLKFKQLKQLDVETTKLKLKGAE